MALNIAAMQEHPKVVSSFLEGRAIRQAEDMRQIQTNALQNSEARAAAKFQREEQSEQKAEQFKYDMETAKQTIAAVEQVKSAGAGAKELVEKQFPEIVSALEKGGTKWADIDNDSVLKLADQVGARAMADAGIMPNEPYSAIGKTQQDVKHGHITQAQADASLEKRETVNWQRKTRDLDNGMKQDYDYNPNTREEMDAGKPYKAKDASYGEIGNEEDFEAAANAIANRDKPVPTGRAALTPLGMSLARRAKEINPDVSESDYAVRAATKKAFASGVESRKVRSMNTAIDHLSTMDKLVEALDNGDVTLINKAYQAVGRHFGKTAPTNLEAASQMVGQEIVAAVVQNAGTGTEREEAKASYKVANSEEQLKEVSQTYRELLGGQLKSLSSQYEQGTFGLKDFSRFLTPATKKALHWTDAPASSGPVKVNSAAEAMKLSEGAEFTIPDGRKGKIVNGRPVLPKKQ